ncbi:hypothetical protein S7711_09193 [Stachybotrys chartarum IBT 7711]|uniref:Glycosyl hydrolase family 32 N-terminal domain-containing protein n=1 Tax=Stachybotrys chartarum (strain CBS 109288 / IBT 7711) TaxID=1280523 RepID=A0A084B7P8_STACB|nr:hypothetical protein S7711_09193 [Stachybotrys chartarum IBT 7711]
MSVNNVSAGLKPTRPEQITLEAWSQGFMVGSLIIMAGITLSNMRSGVLLHKLILIELALAIPNGFFAFFEPPAWGWFLSATVVPLLTSWTLHNVIAWIKNKPFLEPRGSAIYIGTVILVQPYWILEIYANFAYFNTDNSRLFTLTRPFEAICRDPWWIFTAANLFYNIHYRYELSLVDIIRVSPRFGILLFCMTLSIIFIIIDLLSVTPVIPIGVINPFWKFAFVFKCLTDTIILDDFKVALDKLSRHRRTQLLPFDALGNFQWSLDDQMLDKKPVMRKRQSEELFVEQVETDKPIIVKMLIVNTIFPDVMALRRFSLLSLALYASTIQPAASQTRPSYHITPGTKWMNDPQRPFFLGGEWHLYYLYNADFDTSNPGSGGTEWYHATSTDMVHWTRRGVAIEKYRPNPPSGIILGDIETGSAVVDTDNTAGFGQNVVVAILTQMADGLQQQSLFYSVDNGYSFTPYEGNPVMPSPNPGARPAFRDPKIFWYGEAGHWVMSLAEGNKIGFYTSPDLKTWTYTSGFIPENFGVDLGILECPDLYQMDPDGDSTDRTWILAVGANGYRYGRTTGTAYWTGEWDGNGFTATNDFPQWMDDGPDFYATVSWDNPNDRYGSRYAIGWMNNWDYAASLPYYGDFAGQDSMVREVKLMTINGSLTLVSLPIRGYEDIFAPPISASGRTITTNPASASLPGGLTDGAYVIRATISKNDGDNGNEVRFRIKSDQSFSTTVGYDFRNSQAFLVRDSDGSATDSMARVPKQAYDAVRTALNPSGGRTIDMMIYVDWNSVEVFVNDGVEVLSALIYPNPAAEGIQVVSDTGSLTLVSFSYGRYET